MISDNVRETIRTLSSTGTAKKEIARLLSLDIKTVRSILNSETFAPKERSDKMEVSDELLETLYTSCKGYAHRMQEVLEEEHQIKIGYSTLTRLIREKNMRSRKKRRSSHYEDVPGEEMQHDTSPYILEIGGIKRKVIASSLYIRYSKMRYIKFYPVFNRFVMKCFLFEALQYFGFSASVCIIDNTNLAISSGTGGNAIFNREMIEFANQFGFRWKAHWVKHSDRKAGVERSFYTIETSFFPGRSFSSFDDLNLKGIQWATIRYAERPQSKTKLIPLQLFEHEKSFLIKINQHLQPSYREHHRLIDAYGYVSFNGNYYWIPEEAEKKGRQFKVLEYEKKIEIYQKHKKLTEYSLPAYDIKNKRVFPPGVKIKNKPNSMKKGSTEEERSLRALGAVCCAYVDFIHSAECRNRQKPKLIRDLYSLSKRLSSIVFSETLKQALKFKIDSLISLERIAQNLLQKDLFSEIVHPINSDYQNREEYRAGRFSSEADLKRFQDLLEDEAGRQQVDYSPIQPKEGNNE
ncbi:MAG: helix-turn-helix domain-containing protein [Spirochaetia bacterium]|jgi:transposase|nr:helix-turn-helix domain-containing protein [Spirochaetia bacterium]